MRRLGVSRRHLFEAVERPALTSLPMQDYEFAEWRLARVATDYHVEFKNFFYSVPHGLIRQQVDIRATSRQSRYSTAASASPLISVAMADGATARTLSTCPAPTADMPSGRLRSTSSSKSTTSCSALSSPCPGNLGPRPAAAACTDHDNLVQRNGTTRRQRPVQAQLRRIADRRSGRRPPFR